MATSAKIKNTGYNICLVVITSTTDKTTGYNTNLVVITSATQTRQQKAITSAKHNTSVAKNTTKTKVSIKLQDTPIL